MKKQAVNPNPGVSRWIGILNIDGNLYRVIEANTPGDAIRAADFLQRLGLLNRIGIDGATFQMIDTMTKLPLRTAWSGLFQMAGDPHPIPAVPRLKR